MSMFVKGNHDVSRLVERLLARQKEEAGEPSDVVGMPLGLPALSPTEIQLIETWIAQGRPLRDPNRPEE